MNIGFKDAFASATTTDERIELASRLIRTGDDSENDKAAQYVLYRKAMDLGVLALDLDTVGSACNALGRFFIVDALRMKADSAVTISKSPRSPEELSSFSEKLADLSNEAMAADRYEISDQMANLGLAAARRASDADLTKKMLALASESSACRIAYTQVKRDIEKLSTNPNDPGANLTVGRFHCFYKGKWDKGLAELNQCSEPMLKNLARKERALPQTPQSQTDLADEWWMAAEMENAMLKSRIRDHARTWYRLAEPSLTGLAKVKVDARIGDAPTSMSALGPVKANPAKDTSMNQQPAMTTQQPPNNNRQPAVADRFPIHFRKRSFERNSGTGQTDVEQPDSSPPNWPELKDTTPDGAIELIHELKVASDTYAGAWEIREGDLYSTKTFSKFEFPFHPPEEYDYKVVCSRTSGHTGIFLVCCAAGKQFTFDVGNQANDHTVGFSYILDGNSEQNTTCNRINGSWITNGRPLTIVVSVRRNGVKGFVNGQLAAEWRTNYSDMHLWPGWSLGPNLNVGLGTSGSVFDIHSAQIVPVNR